MLVDQNNPNILALLCESVECLNNGGIFGLAITDEEVPLRVWRFGNMPDAGKK